MNMAVGILTIFLGGLLFFLTLIPTVMGLAAPGHSFLKVPVLLAGLAVPIWIVWLGWSFLQGHSIVPLWVGLIPAAFILGWVVWIIFGGNPDSNPRSRDYKKSKILKITPSEISKIIHEGAALSPGLSQKEDRQIIMESIDHAAIIAKAIQVNDPNFRLPLDKDWPYSTDGICEIVFSLMGIYLDKFHELTQFTKNELLASAKASSNAIDSIESAAIDRAILFFKNDSNRLSESQKISFRKSTGTFLWLVEKHLYAERPLNE